MSAISTVVKERRKIRKYDILLLGATGYTGALTAEYIVQHFPSDLKWAIAGRSRAKLEALAKKLKDLDPERLQPEIEVVSFDRRGQLDAVVKNSKVCISVVLYWQVGEVVVQSCVENGTDYIDVAGDIPLLRTCVDKYHETAVKTEVALIHLCGVFAAPQDLLTWATVRELAQKASRKTKEVIFTNTEIELAASGGTVDSLMAESSLDPQTYKESRRPWALSPVEGSQPSMSTSALGLRRDPVLGLLSASSFSFGENRALVHRTWGLLSSTDQAYGPNFQYYEFDKVSSTFAGLSRILNTALLAIMLKISLLRTIAKLFFPKPGEGPDVEKSRRSRTKFEAVAIAEPNGDSNPPRAYASFSYPSGGYHTTAVVLAEGAASLLYTRRLEGGYKGGCLTPAFLGDDLLRRIQAAGVVFKVHMV